MKRKPATKPIRRLLIARQRGLCACGCGEWLEITGFDVDHWVPLGLGGGNDLPNLRALRKECHKPKTARDVRAIRKADRQRAKAEDHERRQWEKIHKNQLERRRTAVLPKGRKLTSRGFQGWRAFNGEIRNKPPR